MNYVKKTLLVICVLMTSWLLWAEESPISNFEIEESANSILIKKYIGKEEKVIIPEKIKGKPVTEISWELFIDCSIRENITELILPDTVKEIESYAFSNLKSLTKVKLPSKITNIYLGLFQDCTSLTDIEIPNNVVEIGSGAFYGCTSLKYIKFPESLERINRGAFQDCISIETLTFPKKLAEISGDAFSGCDSLETVNYAGAEEDCDWLYDFGPFVKVNYDYKK